MNISNRKAYHEYFIIREFICGLKLIGSEVKSIANGDANLQDAYCMVIDDEVYIKNLFISKNKNSSYNNHEEKSDRKLLLTKKEINIINKEVKVSGISLIPLEIFPLNGKFKVKIAISKGKKNWDKRETIKNKDISRQIKRELNK